MLTVQRYDDDATLVTAAVSGQAYAVATSATLVNQIKKQSPKLNFEPKMTLTVFDLAIGLQKNQPELKEKLNAWIETKIKNGKLNTIYYIRKVSWRTNSAGNIESIRYICHLESGCNCRSNFTCAHI